MDTLTQSLRAFLRRDQVITDPEELLVYECDGLTHYRARPRAVVLPHSTEEVAEVLRVLAREGASFAPRGAGTGLSGGALAVNGGVQLNLARMRRVLKVDVENRLAVVETGMVNAQLSRAVARHGLHYVPDPSSQASCTIGGNIAENAGGIHCLKYGTTVDHVLGARVVLSDGEVVELGGAGIESSGYDLLGVFVGSEGTFGVATEATVRLTPVAPSVRTLLADFTDIDDASRAVSAIIAEGIIPAALEMVDGATIRAVEASVFAAGLPTDAEAALLVELDGLDAGLDAEASRVEGICRASGARGVRHAADEVERKKLWAARKGAFGAMGRIMPDMMLQDAVVPRSRLPEILADTYRIAAKYRLRLANVFHAGDGNLHPIMCYDARDRDEVERVREAGREIVETCVRAGGTITGEHGVGLDKSDYLPLVFSEDTLRAMLQLRAAFDPSGRCNPGKVIPVLRGCGEARAAVKQKSEVRSQKSESSSTSSATAVASAAHAAHAAATHVQTARLPSTSVARAAFHAERARAVLADIVGVANVETGAGETLFVAPSSAEEASELLLLSSREGWKVSPSGAARLPDACDAPSRADAQTSRVDETTSPVGIFISTKRMARVVEHEPADLVATAEAGVTLADFNATLAGAGQWLPLDPPGASSVTLGGVAARGLGGAQALGYGPPRSKVLGMRVVLADGRVIRVGGRVVKNVAGYDLCKLFVGSRGTLGLITELTFKLRPRPARESTLVAHAADHRALLRAARAVVAAPLFPVAAELLSTRAAALGIPAIPDGCVLMLRFGGNAETVSYQLSRAREMLDEHAAGAGVETFDDDDQHLWSGLAALTPEAARPLVFRASVLPGSLDSLLAAARAYEPATGAAWHAGAGDGRLRVFADAPADGAASLSMLEELRRVSRELGGQLILERAPAEMRRAFDARAEASSSSTSLMRRVKQQLDPSGTFSAGSLFDDCGR
ncbi:MAG TPA: FAD-linked oxidase C-terminal domain-containing protein [Pyrinomonadaceae bacterium]